MGIRLTILWLWRLIDPVFYFFSRLYCIKDHKMKPSVFRVRMTKYKGKNFILSDGTEIAKNDLLIKIHLHNVRIMIECVRIKNELKRARIIHRMVFHSMPALAVYLRNHPEEGNIKGIIGITTLNKGVKALGFESYIPANRFYRSFKKIGQLPILLLAGASIKNIERHKLNYLFISKQKLYTLYGLTSPSK